MQRLGLITAVLSIFTLASVPACNKGKDDGGKANTGQKDGQTPGDADSPAEAEAGEAEAGPAEAEAGAAEAGEAAAEAGAAEAGETSAGETGAAAGEAGETETGGEDPVPALLEQVESLDTDDAEAKQALADALDAGAAKLDAAKAANARGEDLLTKGESERAEAFFTWARDTHNHYADPVYNLAKLAAYAGDLAIAKEHLAELQKRGNKKLMKKVGVEPAFAPLHDDPDVRKIYEQ